MTLKTHTTALLVLTAMALAACSSEPTTVATQEDQAGKPVQTTPQASMVAKQVGAEQDAPYVTEISFAKGSTNLNAEAKAKIQKLMKSLSPGSEIKEVKVVTWADQDYPSETAKKLAEGQIQIAKNRNEEIKKYFEETNKDWKLDLHNMAERPGAFKDAFGTSDSRIKKSFEAAGIPTTDSLKKMPSKASKSIVMLVLKDESK